MKYFIKKFLRLRKYKQFKNTTPIDRIHDYVSQLAVLYSYANSKDYRESQRDIINLRLSDIKNEINNQFKYLVC